MKKRHIALAALALFGVGAGTAAYVASPTIHEGNPGETPELGRYGEYQVGTREVLVDVPNRVRFSKAGMATGQLSENEEMPALQVRVYFPAQVAERAEPISYSHFMTPPAMEPFLLEYNGRAFADAEPLSEGKFPLVVMSHGFNGWSTQFSNLAEHIASRGYVVASIDHADMQIDGVADFVHSFSLVLTNRTIDQRAVLAELVEGGAANREGFYSLIDPERVAMIGYSMGGYGALATAGADYNYDGKTFDTVPSAALDATRAVVGNDAAINAMVLFAPWGGQPDNRVWNGESLATITAPTLIVSGSQDDVSNHAEGVSWIFDQLNGTSRHMLTFREARHSIVGNAFDVPEDAPFRVTEFVSEPVWRQDRINGINQHFVAAFLDLHLKGDADKASYLNVPVANANDSQWETGFGDLLNGEFAGPDEAEHWRGFQKRWAAGLDLKSKRAGE
ncbi:alpha/beta hydrolase [Erythrobacter sp. YT30]|uniref:alpha/beta hydrolase family protein n=1 Tax=Erythrobacter sp. YT30 TaxID=1735012 RepID=UPI00076C83A2|nr:alpha/beta hydrolase [Erythrobacter sp. YT30]KWV91654.1 hypothetical protein AUC45_10595 [Erythrobacter sp. YT30]